MTAPAHVKHATASSVIVSRTGLVHRRDRHDRAWIRTHGNRQFSILISATYIRRRIAELAREIASATRKSEASRGKPRDIFAEPCEANNTIHPCGRPQGFAYSAVVKPLATKAGLAKKGKKNEINFLIVLKGAAFFGCRLAQEIFRAGGPDVIIHFVSASSYGKSTCSSGRCRITGRLNLLRGRDVIVVEDICDTGLTLDRIKERLLKKEHASSVKTCVLLDKPGRRLARLKGKPIADFIGFQIPKTFVAGFGLEYLEKYRELPFIVGLRKA